MKIAGYLFIVLTILLVGCNSTKDIPFSSHSWYINDITRNVESTDTTLSFTLCSDMTEREFPLIGNENEVLKYKGLRSYLNKICSHLEVKCDSILFYAPTKGILIIGITEDKLWKPRSQSFNILTETPFTLWVRDDDVEDWNRKPDEIYTNVVLDRAEKQLWIIDRFTYKHSDIALIHIIQTETRKFMSLGLPLWSCTWADVTDPTCLEPIANWLEGHRNVAFENFRLSHRSSENGKSYQTAD
ncbi:MAG: hypothetical protein HDS26_06170 [Bacteroides sp.]|nr:hypothetical protein [Bacteroides sp.]